MRLYIDNQEVVLPSNQDINMTFRFLDTYNPSAIKTSYSKTISLPDTPENTKIFSTQKVRHSFSLFEDNGGRLLEKGYCILDRVKSVGIVKTYEITLYGGLGDFFYNLKGDEDKPKTLADLYWGDITGLDKVQEDLETIMTWDNQYVFNTWFSSSFSSLWDTFRAVPCIYDDKVLSKNLSIVPATGGLFPATLEGSTPFVGRDGSEALLVEAEDNTCYAKQDFRCELMPLGIKYKSIIETICKPENNGGYEVYLDPKFFTDTNPYWTNTFLLKSLPTQDYESFSETSNLNDFSCSLVRIGNYLGGANPFKTETIVPQSSATPWSVSGTGLQLEPGTVLDEVKANYDLTLFLHVSNSAVSYNWEPEAFSVNPLVAQLTCKNLDTNQSIVLATERYEGGTRFRRTSPTADPSIYVVGSLRGVADIPTGWTHISFTVSLSSPSQTFNFFMRVKSPESSGTYTYPVRADFCGPSYSRLYSGLPDSYLSLDTKYLSSVAFLPELKFTKKDLLSGTKTPFDYLVWYTKMFNLRFYLEPGNKKVSIFLPEDMVQQYDPVNIQDRICYDREYSRTRKIIDEGFLKFNLVPAKNSTVESYEEAYGDTLLDKSYAIPQVEGKGQKEYLSSELKIGSKARNTSAFAARHTEEGYVFYGFNQTAAYPVSYVSGSTRPSEDLLLNYEEGSQRYDFLTLDDGPSEVLVMYSGLKDLPWPEYSAIISRTSVDMIRCAGSPCWISGWVPKNQGVQDSFLGAEFIHVHTIPHYGLVPSNVNYDWGLTYSSLNYESLIATGTIYDKYLKTFIENVYGDPLVVECYVRLLDPDFRKLYWFDNNYWVLVEVNNFNYRDEPVKCKFIRYNRQYA